MPLTGHGRPCHARLRGRCGDNVQLGPHDVERIVGSNEAGVSDSRAPRNGAGQDIHQYFDFEDIDADAARDLCASADRIDKISPIAELSWRQWVPIG